MPVAQQQLDDALGRAGFSPEEMAGEPLEDPRFTHGQVLAVSGLGTPYELASNEPVELTAAELKFIRPDPISGTEPLLRFVERAATNIWYIGKTSGLGKGVAIIRSGRFVWPSHGLGPSKGRLWLSKDGTMVCQANAPEGDVVGLEQELGLIIDADTILWDPKQATVRRDGK